MYRTATSKLTAIAVDTRGDVIVAPADIPGVIRRSSPAWLRAGIVAYEGLQGLPLVGVAVAAFAPVFVVTARRPA